MKAQFTTQLIAGALTLTSAIAWSAPTKVGNGDDGSDLEGATPLTDGPIVDARREAVKLLKRLQVEGIAGLGQLIPEVEKSELYLAKKDTAAAEDADTGSFHQDMSGQVYARTFAEPHAATRFFPAATHLNRDQLVALHIHEGLHRALAPSVRENESVVSAMTLSVTAPGGSRDRIQTAAAKHLPDQSPPSAANEATDRYPIPEDARVKQPSLFSYSYRRYSLSNGPTLYPIEAMHSIQSYLYPFGSDRVPLGIGIEASLVSLNGVGSQPNGSQMGPLGLSARFRLWSSRGFDVAAWSTASLNMLSAQELKSSPVGRDVFTLGLSMRKDLPHFHVENFLSYSLGGSSSYAVGPYAYDYSYGGVVNVSSHIGTRIGKFHVGGFVELGLADHFGVSGPGFTGYDIGRYRVITAGPEVSFRDKNFQVSLAARSLLNASEELSYDALGNLMGQGVGKGSITASLGVYF